MGAPTVSQTRLWRPEVLTGQAAEWRSQGETIDAQTDVFNRAVDSTRDHWGGVSADTAHSKATDIDTTAKKTVAVLSAASDAATSGAANIGSARDVALAAVTAAEAEQFLVADDGTVTVSPALFETAVLALGGNMIATMMVLQGKAKQHEAAIKSALAALGAADQQASTAVLAAFHDLPAKSGPGGGGVGDSKTPSPPPKDASAADNKKWWDSLSPEQQKDMIATHPADVGNRDGIPAGVRHDANVSRFDDERARLEAERDRLRTDIDNHPFGGAFTNEDAGLWYTEKKLADLDELEKVVRENPDGKLMLMDLESGNVGKAAFAVGADPDTADHVSVTTPGFTSTVHDSLSSMVGESKNLNEVAVNELDRMGRPEQTVSNISWMGYEAPNTTGPGNFDTFGGFGDVATEGAAKQAAPDLAGFYDGIDAASEKPDPHITALGHSYGSLTTGLALQDPQPGQPVDDFVIYGSPGVNAHDETDLGLRDGHAWVMEGQGSWSDKKFGDWAVPEMGKTHQFGPDPSESDFEQLSSSATTTPDGVQREGVYTHADYPRDGSNDELRTSGYNMAVVIAGLAEGDKGLAQR